MNILENLNDMQKKAVTTTEGPVLVLAGAGSGKTTVLVNRLVYILSENNIGPYRILAITFTNKAANEMKDRIRAKIGAVADNMWIGTFHSVCVRILRQTIDLIGYDRDFLIYDTNDSAVIIKECLKELNLAEKVYPPRAILAEISRSKDAMITPEMYESKNKNDYKKSKYAQIFRLYQAKLKKYNAVDFDDIILKTIEVLSNFDNVLDEYQEKFKYIMVDEYQDTNNAQYLLVSLLAGKYRNLCVVGDDDQSIYKFRGANIMNILNFEKQYPEAVLVKLEQNYRSTQSILDAANAIISHNGGRKGKDLWTNAGVGDKITYYTATNEHEEGLYISKKIAEYKENGGEYSDCAVLYRMNAQSRVIEEMMIREGIPYRVLAGLRFYDRKEIKDITAYLRVSFNTNDNVCLKRIINVPRRGIGLTTIEKAEHIAAENDITLYEVLKSAENYADLKRAAARIKAFTDLIDDFTVKKDELTLSEYVEYVAEKSGYIEMLSELDESEKVPKLENLKEFISVSKEYEINNSNNLADFLEKLSLVADVDNYDQNEDSVVLMTIHSAKGLEFPVVFLPGMERGIFPSDRCLSEEDIEEERRLCYVAVTRAKKKLYISRAESRMVFGTTTYHQPSNFIKEIPLKCLEIGSAFKVTKETIFGKPKHAPMPLRPTTLSTKGNKFSKDDVVVHQKFGRGVVLTSEKFGDDYKIEVLFDGCGKKLMMANFARLEKVEE